MGGKIELHGRCGHLPPTLQMRHIVQTLVIPAKAGIQKFNLQQWIPAFAGMTRLSCGRRTSSCANSIKIKADEDVRLAQELMIKI